MNATKMTTTARLGEWMRLHSRAIRWVQWCVVFLYAVLILVPVFLPLPDAAAHIWSNLTLGAQFVFWGIWWPFVLLSMVFMGRIWCGVLCPEGTLTEFASKHGRGGSIPRWVRWGGWPFVAFVLTTIYGQLVSVYQYPKAVLLVLGGSTVGAIIVGYLYGQNKRVWCRYLCPVNGVFALLAKLSPLHYRVNETAWRASYANTGKVAAVNCAPLLPLRTMQGAADCHMCARCSGHRDAIGLEARAFAIEITKVGQTHHSPWESILLLYGLCGVAIGAFHWTVSPWFVALKQAIALWLVEHDIVWPLDTDIPWWVLTHYPGNNDVFSWLDGATVTLYILLTSVVLGSSLSILLWISSRIVSPSKRSCFHHLVQALIPVAGCGVFVGLSATTVSLLRGEHIALTWVNDARAALLIATSLWSVWIAWCITARYTLVYARRCLAMVPVLAALMFIGYSWMLMFLIW